MLTLSQTITSPNALLRSLWGKARLAPAIGLAGMVLAGGWWMAPSAWADRGTASQRAVAKDAVRYAADAKKALAAKKNAAAIGAAERAVAAVPTSADYRFLLGQAYLAGGRFQSAATAFQDCLTLDPDRAQAAFKLALTQIALGNTDKAKDLLVATQSGLAVSDYGLALALAGDTQTGIQTLEDAVRSGEDNAMLRQNLALAYALAGRWDSARTQAAVDLAPDQVAQRLGDWAGLAKPGQGMAQISALLGVHPQDDPGLPSALALNSAQDASAPAALAGPVDAVPPVVVAPLTVPASAAEPVAVAAAVDAAPPQALGAAQFETPPLGPDAAKTDPAQPVGDRLAPLGKAGLIKGHKMRVSSPNTKGYVVQIGAFRSTQSVAAAWRQSVGRWPLLRRYEARQARQPAGIFRLSVGGFATRSDAQRLCQSLHAKGARCFTRVMTSSDLVRWAAVRRDRPARQLALR